MGCFILNHCDADRVREDFDRSEKLGMDILNACCEPCGEPSKAAASRSYDLVRRVNIVEQTEWLEWVEV